MCILKAHLLQNWKLPFQLLSSFLQVRSIFKKFSPDAVFGVGGYSSFPVLRFAQQQRIPTFLHEANSFAGKSNLMLSKKAELVMVGTEGMEKFFDTNTLVYTGNPVRREIAESTVLREEAFEYFGLKSGKPTLLVIGGSLGARSINAALNSGVHKLIDAGIQVIWQTGKGNLSAVSDSVKSRKEVCVTEFIAKMNYAYKAADVVVSRAGAIALAEICVCGKPSVLVPFPLAAEDHQTANAKSLVQENAAIIVADSQAKENMVPTALRTLNDKDLLARLAENSFGMGKPKAAQQIAETILKNSTCA